MNELLYDYWMRRLDSIEAQITRAKWHIRILYCVIGVLVGLLLRAWGVV